MADQVHAGPSNVGKKRKRRKTLTDSESKRRKIERNKGYRQKTIHLGGAIDRWNQLKSDLDFTNHEETATFLLDSYTNYRRLLLTTRGPVEFKPSMTGTPVGIGTPPQKALSSISPGSSKISGVSTLSSAQVAKQRLEKKSFVDQSLQDRPEDMEISVEFTEEDIYDPDDPTFYLSDEEHGEGRGPNISLCDRAVTEQDPQAEVADIVLDILEEEDEDVNEETCESPICPNLKGILEVDADNMPQESACFAYPQCLRQLATVQIPNTCPRKGCNNKVKLHERRVGTAFNFRWICEGTKKHVLATWASQPMVRKQKQINLADLMLASAVTLSGNNYAKVALLFRFANVSIVSRSAMFRMQSHCVVPVVNEYWTQYQQELLAEFKDRDLVIAGDGRMDSPGYSAKFCTYTGMEFHSKKILDIQVVDKRETQLKSPNMELVGLQKVLTHLTSRSMKIVEIITDAHPQVMAMLRRNEDIKHSLDVWHGAKNLGKKLSQASAPRETAPLRPWVRDVTTHFWHCSRTCEGHVEVLMNKWQGVLHHTVNQHEWALGSCEHEAFSVEEQDRDKEWLEPNSVPHVALQRVAMDSRFLKNLSYYVNFRTTAELESFNNHILMYAAKRFAYSFPVYRTRCQLAAIDYNKHLDRPYLKNKQGDIVYNRVYSKVANHWTAVARRVPKDYAYIADIMSLIIRKVTEEGVVLRSKTVLSADDPRHIASTIAPSSPPATRDIVQKKISRFTKEDNSGEN